MTELWAYMDHQKQRRFVIAVERKIEAGTYFHTQRLSAREIAACRFQLAYSVETSTVTSMPK